MLDYDFSKECKELIICILKWLRLTGFNVVESPDLERYISPKKNITFHFKKNNRIYQIFVNHYNNGEGKLYQIGNYKNKFRPEFEILVNTIIVQLIRMGYTVLHKEAKGFKYPFHQVVIIVEKNGIYYKMSIFDGKWESIFNEIFA
ncbi:MAG: hypothetical protein ACFFD5_02985 [Candidatus Thorarchaeota archaeon]